jgi:hypothetical protein
LINVLPIERVLRDAVESYIKNEGITYVEFSRRTGVNVGTIKNMLYFQTRGRLVMWQKLLDAAGIEIGYRVKESA